MILCTNSCKRSFRQSQNSLINSLNNHRLIIIRVIIIIIILLIIIIITNIKGAMGVSISLLGAHVHTKWIYSCRTAVLATITHQMSHGIELDPVELGLSYQSGS